MPLSLKSKLSKLRYKGQITDTEYQELIQKLEGHDRQLRADVIDECIAELGNDYWKIAKLEQLKNNIL